jgi:hypothetical protein
LAPIAPSVTKTRGQKDVRRARQAAPANTINAMSKMTARTSTGATRPVESSITVAFATPSAGIDAITVSSKRDGHTVDARLDLAIEERLAGVLPTAVFSDLRHRVAHLVTLGVQTEVVEEDETVCRGGPGLALVLLAVTRFSLPRGE